MKARTKRRVTIISRESDDKTLDIRLLEEELLRRGIEVEVLTKLLTKTASIKSIGYFSHMIKQELSILQSKVLVLDTYCIVSSMLPQKKSLETVQMWHALSAIKKFGWQTVGKEDGSSKKVASLMKMHAGYDHVICCSDVTAEYFCEAFRTDRSKIVKLGLPRIDYIRRKNPKLCEKIYRSYPSLRPQAEAGLGPKQNILYAPTFHKGKPVDVKGLAAAIDFDKYNLIVKLHPIDKESSERIAGSGIIYDSDYDTYDMLKVADIVISDYSSFVVEASLANKPMYLYAYDEDSYKVTNGLNMNFHEEAIGKYVFKSAGELAAALAEEYDYEALEAFRNKYIDIDVRHCTERLADYIEELLDK